MNLYGDSGYVTLVGDTGLVTLVGDVGFQPASANDLLLESGEWLLLQDGSRILLEV